MSHACHALSDIIVDMSQQPPRNLRCRPIIIQQSAIWQAGTPIQVEAQISFQGRNANSSNAASGNAEGAESAPSETRSQESAAETPAAAPATEQSTSQPAQNDQPQATQQQPRRQTQVSVGEFFVQFFRCCLFCFF